VIHCQAAAIILPNLPLKPAALADKLTGPRSKKVSSKRRGRSRKTPPRLSRPLVLKTRPVEDLKMRLNSRLIQHSEIRARPRETGNRSNP
jgi:hypothetical protein